MEENEDEVAAVPRADAKKVENLNLRVPPQKSRERPPPVGDWLPLGLRGLKGVKGIGGLWRRCAVAALKESRTRIVAEYDAGRRQSTPGVPTERLSVPSYIKR